MNKDPQTWINWVKSQQEGEEIQLDEETLYRELLSEEKNPGIIITIFSILGGILATQAFTGFLVVAGMFDSPAVTVITGLVFMAVAIYMNRNSKMVILDTSAVSLFLSAFVLVGYGLNAGSSEDSGICVALIIMALTTLFIQQHYLLSFLSVLIIAGNLLALILINDSRELIHLYVSASAILLTYFYLAEANIITRKVKYNLLYNPVRVGLVFSLLGGLALLGVKALVKVNPHFIWISSLVVIACLLFLVNALMNFLGIREVKTRFWVFLLSACLLGTTVLNPAISGALLVILLGFRSGHRTGFVAGALSFVYFISQYYYDLSFTLLVKSELMLLTGLLFFLLYFFIHKKLKSHENDS